MNLPLSDGWTRGLFSGRNPLEEPPRQFGDLPTSSTPVPEVEHEQTAVGDAVEAMNRNTTRWAIS